MKTSDVEINRTLARRWFDLISEARIDDLCDITAPTWTLHGGPPGLPPGPDGIRQLFWHIGPIVQKWTIEDVIAEGSKVVVRATNTCDQENFLGIPGRGRTQTFTATFIHAIAYGKVVETWRNADDLGRVLQLGARIQWKPAGHAVAPGGTDPEGAES